jgi:Grap2 and cyclin-D-interacting
MTDVKLTTVLSTTLSLLDRCTHALTSVPPGGTAPPPNSPSPIPLLSTSAKTLRAQTTKVSLLIITPPFTASAICSILSSLNDAILPNLLTATLLLSPSNSTKAYSAEAICVTKATLRDLKGLAHLVEARSKDGKPKAEPSPQQKSAITEATGKIWEDCDELNELAEKGIAGFVAKKAEQYLELIRDAIKEIEEWDPDDDDSDDENNSTNGGDEFSGKDCDTTAYSNSKTTNDTHVAKSQDIAQTRSSSLTILLRIPQSLQVVIHQRLKKGLPPSPTTRHRHILDNVLTKLEQTSTCIDDVAERLYTHDALGAILTAEKARATAIEIVEAVLQPWDRDQSGFTSAASRTAGRREQGKREEEEEEEEKEEEKEGEGEEGSGGAKTAANQAGQVNNRLLGTGAGTETREDRYINRALEWIKSVSIHAETVSSTQASLRQTSGEST